MPGRFHVLGLHLSQHLGDKCKVEMFAPEYCHCDKEHCDTHATWRAALGEARSISTDFEGVLRAVMPTENARQAAPREHILTAFAKYRELVEALMLSNQHALCVSMAHKVPTDRWPLA